jgi:hypothetical protein
MSVTKPIFIKLILALQICVNNYNIKFHENPTNCGVTDTRSQTKKTNGCGLHTKHSFYTVKNAHTQWNLPITKPEGMEIFFIAGRFHLIWVLEFWILGIPDLCDCIKVFRERQTTPPFYCFLKGLNTCKSNGYWSTLTGGWVSTMQCMQHSAGLMWTCNTMKPDT